VDQARARGVPFAYVVADAGYGDNSAFLLGLDDRQVAYGERPFFPAVHRYHQSPAHRGERGTGGTRRSWTVKD
jgi:hypothetical protein